MIELAVRLNGHRRDHREPRYRATGSIFGRGALQAAREDARILLARGIQGLIAWRLTMLAYTSLLDRML